MNMNTHVTRNYNISNIYFQLKFAIVSDTLPYLDEIAKKYSSPMRLWFGSKMLIFIADAENAEIVLKSKDCLNKPDIFYNVLRDSMSVDGILTSQGELRYFHINFRFFSVKYKSFDVCELIVF